MAPPEYKVSELLQEILEPLLHAGEAPRADDFRIKHEDEIDLLDGLAEDGLIESQDGKYFVTPKGLARIPSEAKALTKAADQLLGVLKEHYRQNKTDPAKAVELASMAEIDSLPARVALRYYNRHFGGLASTSPDNAGLPRRVGVAESILGTRLPSDQLAELKQAVQEDNNASSEKDPSEKASNKKASPAIAAPDAAGAGLRIRYEADDDQLALGADQLAEALAATFETAKGQLCFAVLGHWGRGKTSLLRRMERLLPKFSWMKSDRYEVAWLSAWKYPAVPQIWVHLYETIAQKAFGGTWRTWVPRAIRANLARHGVWPLVFQLLAIAALMSPLWHFVNPWAAAAGMAGLFASLGAGKSARSVLGPARRLRERYLTRPSHQDKLGLQATIGRDLQALLIGWLKDWKHDDEWWWRKIGLTTFLLGVAPIGTALVVGLWDVGPSHYAALAAALGWLALSILFGVWIRRGAEGPERLLLVVDDLDRCHADEVCAVIESLKLFAEDKAFKERIQVAVLVEERALRFALRDRFKEQLATLQECSSSRAEYYQEHRRLLAEHFQKLFTAHLRLPRLRDSELRDVLQKYLREARHPPNGKEKGPREQGSAESEPAANEPPKEEGRTDSAPASEGTASEDGGESPADEAEERPKNTVAKLRAENLTLSETETAMLRGALSEITSRTFATPGPRALRSFLIRYQLVRFLLQMREVEFSPVEAKDALLGKEVQRSELRAVTDMVLAWNPAPPEDLPPYARSDMAEEGLGEA